MKVGDQLSESLPGDIVEILDDHGDERVVRVEWIPHGFAARAVVWFSAFGGVPITRSPRCTYFVPAHTPVVRVFALSIQRRLPAATTKEIAYAAP